MGVSSSRQFRIPSSSEAGHVTCSTAGAQRALESEDHEGGGGSDGVAETTTLSLTVGQWYYVAVGAFGTHTGSYTLTINAQGSSRWLINTPAPDYSGNLSGVAVDWGGDTDYFQFTAPAQTDRVNLTITPGSGLDTYSILYNSSGTVLTTIDNAAALPDTLTNYAITAGNTYYLAVRSFLRTTTGSYQVAVDFNPNAGDPPPTVTLGSGAPMRLNQFGDGSRGGTIGTTEECDVYEFVLDVSGSTTITTSGALDAQFRVYDGSGNPVIATVDGNGAGGDEAVTLSLTAGVRYHVAVGGRGTSTGAYVLSIYGPNASVSSLSVTGPFWIGSSSSTIECGGDIDYWSVVAPAGATSMDVAVDPPSDLSSYIQVYNSAGSHMGGFDTAGAGGVDSGTVAVTAGSTYYLAVSSSYPAQYSTGSCAVGVDFAPDADAGNPPATVTPGTGTWANANPFGDFTMTGAISGNTEVDIYMFVADMSGNQVITLTPAGTLDGQLRIYDSGGNPVTGIIDIPGAGSAESVTVSATAGSWYYIAVAGFGWTQGNYTLTANGPSFTAPTLTPAEPTWTASSSGSVAYGGDLNYVTFVAPAGVTTLNFSVTPVSTLNTYAMLYDGTGALLQTTMNGGTGVADTATGISVTAGATYYLGIGGISSTSTGGYTAAIDFNPDPDYGDPPATITPYSGGRWWQNQLGNIVDVNSITTGNGMRTIASMPEAGGSFTISTTGALNSQVRVYDQNGTALTGIIDATGGGETTTLTLTASQSYYVVVAGYRLTTGSYTLVIDGPSVTTTSITTNAPDYAGGTSALIGPGCEIDYFSFVAPAGTNVFDVTISPAAGLDSYGMVFNSSGTCLGFAMFGGTGSPDTCTVAVTAGQTYVVAVSGANRASSGSYTLVGNFGPDASPVPLTISGTSGNDTISLYQSAGTLTVTNNGASTDYIAANVSTLTINGLEGDDLITVGAGVQACTIDGGLGNDSVSSGDGNDFIRGDDGLDTLRGGSGNDTIMGNTGNDQLWGGLGHDQIQAGLGTDLLFAGDGNDSLYGGDHSDTIHGEAGNDYIEGKGKPDTVYGGDGNDTIYGNAGSDSLLGEAGDDYLYGADNPTVFLDTISGGLGTDRYTADPNDQLSSCELILA